LISIAKRVVCVAMVGATTNVLAVFSDRVPLVLVSQLQIARLVSPVTTEVVPGAVRKVLTNLGLLALEEER